VPARGQGNVEAIVAQNVRPILPQNGRGGGVAGAVCMNGQTDSLRHLPPSAADGFNNLADCIDHELGLLHARELCNLSENRRLGFVGNVPILRRSSEATY
jgi:hypothetical protein